MIYGDDYDTFDDLADVVKQTVDDIRPYRKEFDSIVVTGLSGLVVGAPAALRLKKPLVILRKPGERAHGSFRGWVNVDQLGRRVLWIDDFVSSGATKRRVQDEAGKLGAEVVLQYQYDKEYAHGPTLQRLARA